MSMALTELNGIKTYNFSCGKTMPEFLKEAKKKNHSLRYNQEFRRRIEVIQDFDFPSSSQRVKISKDQNYIIASGVYPPRLKIYDLHELSLKCQRGMDSEVVDFLLLEESYRKVAIICNDRTLEFHAQYGKHYKTRVPSFPRGITFNPFTTDLIVGTADNEVYRLNLEEGKFLPSFSSNICGINCVFFNKELNLLLAAGEAGILEGWDYRQRNKINTIITNNGQESMSLNCDSSGFNYVVGSSGGLVRLYDIRSSKFLIERQHGYELPIKNVKFHESTRNIVSCDEKMIKIFNKDDGSIFTNIEPKPALNDIELVPESGMILASCRAPRIQILFIPGLGPAPKWCPFLDNLTEELEESAQNTVYDEYKFITLEDLEKLNGSHLLGTKFLKDYMHGFLITSKMYEKLRSLSNPFEYEEYRKKKIKDKLDEEIARRIYIKDEQLTKARAGDKHKISDERFSQRLKGKDFEIDEASKEYLLKHPSEKIMEKIAKKRIEEDEEAPEPKASLSEDNESEEESHFNTHSDNKLLTKLSFQERRKLMMKQEKYMCRIS